jgi:hypothetical protein
VRAFSREFFLDGKGFDGMPCAYGYGQDSMPHLLFNVYGFDGAFVGGLLSGVFEFSGDLIHQNYGYGIAHCKDFRASADTKTTRSAGIVNSNFHKTSHNK